VCGDQLVEQYSRLDLTKDVYAVVLVCSLFIWRFLLKNPNNFCAKCNSISVTGSKTPFKYNYILKEHILEPVDTAKYLGVAISSNMTLNAYINNVAQGGIACPIVLVYSSHSVVFHSQRIARLIYREYSHQQ
jgi:hypothetical protein